MAKVMRAVTSIFKKTEIPKVKVPSVVNPTDPAQIAAVRKKAMQQGQKGQAGNVLTGGAGNAYSNQRLGGTQ